MMLHCLRVMNQMPVFQNRCVTAQWTWHSAARGCWWITAADVVALPDTMQGGTDATRHARRLRHPPLRHEAAGWKPHAWKCDVVVCRGARADLPGDVDDRAWHDGVVM